MGSIGPFSALSSQWKNHTNAHPLEGSAAPLLELG